MPVGVVASSAAGVVEAAFGVVLEVVLGAEELGAGAELEGAELDGAEELEGAGVSLVVAVSEGVGVAVGSGPAERM